MTRASNLPNCFSLLLTNLESKDQPLIYPSVAGVVSVPLPVEKRALGARNTFSEAASVTAG
jgi:hypothetical protein